MWHKIVPLHSFTTSHIVITAFLVGTILGTTMSYEMKTQNTCLQDGPIQWREFSQHDSKV